MEAALVHSLLVSCGEQNTARGEQKNRGRKILQGGKDPQKYLAVRICVKTMQTKYI